MAESYQDLCALILKSKRIIIVTGAGISVSAGIPDFRSSAGLYNLIRERYPTQVVRGAELFDASLFKSPELTMLFMTFMAQLKQKALLAIPTATHEFIKLLETQKKLVRCYTQNIDSLELRSPTQKLVQLHGDLDFLICTLCSYKIEFVDELIKTLDKGNQPLCPSCVEKDEIRRATGKRAISVGMLRPNIVLYNEHHKQGEEIQAMNTKDFSKKPDLLLVFGTSLKIVGLKRLVKQFSADIQERGGKSVFVNLSAPPKDMDVFDFFFQETCDAVVDGVMTYMTAEIKIREIRVNKREGLKVKKELAEKGQNKITQYLVATKGTHSSPGLKAVVAKDADKEPKDVNEKKLVVKLVKKNPGQTIDILLKKKATKLGTHG